MTLREALLRGKRRPRALGAGSPTTYRGDGYEFVELRAYVPGDDVRRIDWAATARAGELQTRIVLEDVALTLAAILDDSGSMRVGRRRSLLESGIEAMRAWYGTAASDDRCMRIGPNAVQPSRGVRGELGACIAASPLNVPFDLRIALETARAALPRGSALLAISDWHDLDDGDERLLSELSARFDATALIARDPWYEQLPLRGLVRMRGAEGGSARVYVGRQERGRFLAAVHARHAAIVERLQRTRWRIGVLTETGGSAALADAFGIPASMLARAAG